MITWKRGRGELGLLQPLLGDWKTTAKSPMGTVKCTRIFSKVIDGNYIQLIAKWEFTRKAHEEITLFGIENNEMFFRSFTSDGKNCIRPTT